jgi:hypothetical protein
LEKSGQQKSSRGIIDMNNVLPIGGLAIVNVH